MASFRKRHWVAEFVIGTACLHGCGQSPQVPEKVDSSPADSTVVATASDTGTAEPNSSVPARDPVEETETPLVLIRTNHGEIKVELDPEKAELTVRNFLSYVDSGHYDGTVLHEVEPEYVVVGGSFTEDLEEKPTRTPIRNEAENGLSNSRGTIAMARRADVIDSAAAQFFFNLGENSWLDHAGTEPDEYGYCVFGRVVEGLEVLDRIAQLPTKNQEEFSRLPTDTVTMESVKRIR